MKPSLALLPFALAAAGPLHAQDTWYVGLRQAIAQESGGRDDTYATTSLRGGIDLPVGRQRVFGDASLSRTTFDKNKGSDTDGYSLYGGIDWETVERLSGNVRLLASRSLAPFTFIGLQPTAGGAVPVARTFDNVEKLRDASATARIGVVTRLGVEGSVGHREVAYTAVQYAPLEYRQNSGSLGVGYRFSGLLSMGAGVSAQDTDYPNALGGADASTRRDVYLSARWVPTGASSFDARLNVGKLEFDRQTFRDFSGATGHVSWDWRPTGKLRFVSTLAREAGQDARFVQLRINDIPQLPQLADFSRVSNSLGVRASYAYSGKVGMGASLYHVRSQVASSVVGRSREDGTVLALNADWAALRWLSLGCEAGHAKGSETQSVNTIGCYVQATLR